jgi:hypothetical protein
MLRRLCPPSLSSRLALPLLLASAGLSLAASLSSLPLATTLADYHQPGTQPNEMFVDVYSSANCAPCHGYYDPNQEPYERWAASMMAQSARDPVFHAAMTISNQDASESGELCLRCHAPGAWLAGRSTPADGSALDQTLGDHDGVTCHLCHRLVDPVYTPDNPALDTRVHDALAEFPPEMHNAQFIVDPSDTRRGPFNLGPSFFYHEWRESPYHRESLLCATCHDVSNPVLSKQPNGEYALNALNQQHPTNLRADQFPEQRTYSEWANSQFARARVELNGRFGGNITAVASCQDCHMPKTTGTACNPIFGGAVRTDLPLHDFNGANSWVLRAVRNLYPDSETGLSAQSVADAEARTQQMLGNAADLLASVRGGQLAVRVVNQTGHKLPTGYPEGRRMWIHVRFLDALNQLVGEHGHYDLVNADLTEGNTKVYKAVHGQNAAQAAITGIPAGPTSHLTLNNAVLSDNRIPPRGFTLAGFTDAQAEPVAYSYDEEQYWDDSSFPIPPLATSAEISLYFQTTSKEYIEFLLNENTTNNTGITAHAQWQALGQSAPVLMATTTLGLAAPSCLPPINYGLAKQRINGDYPGVTYLGSPSLAAASFDVVIERATPFQPGVLFFSSTQASTPFHDGTLLLGGDIKRRGTFVTDGTGRAQLSIAISPLMIGTTRNYQAIFRDVQAVDGLGMTDALHVEFCP